MATRPRPRARRLSDYREERGDFRGRPPLPNITKLTDLPDVGCPKCDGEPMAKTLASYACASCDYSFALVPTDTGCLLPHWPGELPTTLVWNAIDEGHAMMLTEPAKHKAERRKIVMRAFHERRLDMAGDSYGRARDMARFTAELGAMDDAGMLF